MGPTIQPAQTKPPDMARERALRCAQTAAEHRGRHILLLDLRKLTSVVDYFVIATGTSRRQIRALADNIDQTMTACGETKLGIEGYEESRWVLIDYGDIVVHLFDDETRCYYDLENLWGGALRFVLDGEHLLEEGKR